jgi:hypothetical protein
MTVYDLDKLATQGPYTVEGAAVMAPTGWKQDDPWFLGASETMHICSTDQNHRPTPEQLANAKLLAHTRNNYLRALKALNVVRDATMFDERACDRIQEPDRIPQGLRELIEELETAQ